MNPTFPHTQIPETLTPYRLLPFQEAYHSDYGGGSCHTDGFNTVIIPEGAYLYDTHWVHEREVGIYKNDITYEEWLNTYYNYKYASLEINMNAKGTYTQRYDEEIDFQTTTSALLYPSANTTNDYLSPTGRICVNSQNTYGQDRWKIIDSNVAYEFQSEISGNILEWLPERKDYMFTHLRQGSAKLDSRPCRFIKSDGTEFGKGLHLHLPNEYLNIHTWFKSNRESTIDASAYGDNYFGVVIGSHFGTRAYGTTLDNLGYNYAGNKITLTILGISVDVDMISYLPWSWTVDEINISGTLDYNLFDPI